MRPARFAFGLTLLAAALTGGSATAVAAEEHADECCAAEEDEPSSGSGDSCPDCPPDCDDECICCARVPAELTARIGLVSLAFEHVRYARSADPAPSSIEPRERDPVPRALPRT